MSIVEFGGVSIPRARVVVAYSVGGCKLLLCAIADVNTDTCIFKNAVVADSVALRRF